MTEQLRALLGLLVSILAVLPPAIGAETNGVLPEWVDAGQAGSIWVEASFVPGQEPHQVVTAASRFLVISVTKNEVGDWGQAAFELKQMVVAARARSAQLKVGLDATPEAVAQLLGHDLAPYIDAYVYRQEPPVMPAQDPAARLWWRTTAEELDLLARLLEASRYGAELVLLEGITVDPAQRRLLAAIQATGSAELVPQPVVSGIGQDRVHFFLDPDSGDYYLAVHAEAGESRHITFALGPQLEARRLYPEPAGCELSTSGRHSRLTLPGEHRFALYELHSAAPEPPRGRVVVDGEVIIDPYEIVVMNQAFQEREAQKVESLDVTEVHDYLVQHRGASPGRHRYRVIERRDQATDYIWIGREVNGVAVPADKLWQGHIYSDRVLLDPLAIELDRTYEYTYLGQETIAGHPTWKIGFRPLEPGAYLEGTVWIDQQIHCQHRLQARHVQPRSPLSSHTITVHYQWVEDNRERFWTWTRIEDSHIWTYLGYHLPVTTEIVRSNHRFNRPDLDDELKPIYQSDARVIRETAEGDLRWLIREGTKSWDVGGSEDTFYERLFEQEPDAAIETESFGRVLAAPGAFSGIHHLGMLVALDPDWRDDVYLYPYYSYINLGVRGSPYQVFVNASEHGAFSVARPGIIRPTWILNASLDRIDYQDRELGQGPEEQVTVFGGVLGLSLAMPVHPQLSFTARLHRVQITFDETNPDNLDPDFVLPVNHWLSIGRLEMRYDRRGFSSEIAVEHTERDRWQPWGYLEEYDPDLPLSWLRTLVRVGYYRQIRRNQSLGITATWERGTGADRFSRIRLNTAGLIVGGYGGRIRYDEGVGLNLDYTGHIKKLFPLRLRIDCALIRPDRELDEYEHLAGVRLFTMLHGPWKTDIELGIGQGLSTSIEETRDQDMTFFFIWSRRF
jgi:hypothetical protein